MLQDYRTHREALAARMRSTSFSPQTAAKKEILMKQYFSALSNALPEKQPELLQKINDLRQAGYRFGASVDPGLHVPFGTPWDPTRFGPYPAKRLAEGAYGKSKAAVEIEVENAREALDHQTLREAMHGRMEPVFADDFQLLRSAIDFHAQRLSQNVEEPVEDILKSVRRLIARNTVPESPPSINAKHRIYCNVPFIFRRCSSSRYHMKQGAAHPLWRSNGPARAVAAYKQPRSALENIDTFIQPSESLSASAESSRHRPMLPSVLRCQVATFCAFLLIASAWAQPAGGGEWTIGQVPTAHHADVDPWSHDEPWHAFESGSSSVDSREGWAGAPSSSFSTVPEWREVQDSYPSFFSSGTDQRPGLTHAVHAGPEQHRGMPAWQQSPEQHHDLGAFQQAQGQPPGSRRFQQIADQHPGTSGTQNLLEQNARMRTFGQPQDRPPGVSTYQHAPWQHMHQPVAEQAPVQRWEPVAGWMDPPTKPSWFSRNADHLLGVNHIRMATAQAIFDWRRAEWELWRNNMRAAMGRPRLLITPVDLSNTGYDRVFVASDGDAVVGSYPNLDADQQAARSLRVSPLLQVSDQLGKVEDERTMHRVRADSRMYVYLNSRSNMDFINREYFLGHAQFLPINREGLDRSTLNKIFGNPRNRFVMPPRTPDGLPLVVLRHTNRGHVGSTMDAHPLAVATLAPAYDAIRSPSHCFFDPVKRRVLEKRIPWHTVGVAWEAREMIGVWEWAWEDAHCLHHHPSLHTPRCLAPILAARLMISTHSGRQSRLREALIARGVMRHRRSRSAGGRGSLARISSGCNPVAPLRAVLLTTQHTYSQLNIGQRRSSQLAARTPPTGLAWRSFCTRRSEMFSLSSASAVAATPPAQQITTRRVACLHRRVAGNVPPALKGDSARGQANALEQPRYLEHVHQIRPARRPPLRAAHT
ncbi:hypothetical protein L1887_57345 [Cichorium endivia]|nr:hypothetical protein L1887_57345 [Cichorium endivia]